MDAAWKHALRVPVKTLIAAELLDFSPLQRAKTLTATSQAFVFCKLNPA